jgi:hypothetical protein
MMTQAKIREEILELVHSNLAWADPMSKVCLLQHERHPDKFPIGSTIESAEEVLSDVIYDLTKLQERIGIEE